MRHKILSGFTAPDAPIHSAPDRAQTEVAEKPEPSGSIPNGDRPSPEKSPDCSHERAGEWQYGWSSINPRAYALCPDCEHILVVLLPKDGGLLSAYSDMTAEARQRFRNEDFPLAVVAAEYAMGRQGHANQVRKRFEEELRTLPLAIVRQMREEVERMSRGKWEKKMEEAEQTMREATALWQRTHREVSEMENRFYGMRRRLRKLGARMVAAEQRKGRPVLCVDAYATCYVYALVSSASPDLLRYIGSTDNPQARLDTHTGGKAHPKVRAFVTETRAAGHVVQMVELWRGGDREEAYNVERKMIADYTALGMADLNTAHVPRRAA